MSDIAALATPIVDSVTTEFNPTVPAQTHTPLRESVQKAVQNYIASLDGQKMIDLYDMVIAEVEAPLLETIMAFTKGNQSRAAKLLGISRGTLRKKLKIYDLE